MIVTDHFCELLQDSSFKWIGFFFFSYFKTSASWNRTSGGLIFASIAADTEEKNADIGNIKRVWYLTELSLWEHILLKKDQLMVEYSISISTWIEWRWVVFFLWNWSFLQAYISINYCKKPLCFHFKNQRPWFMRFIVLSKLWHLNASVLRPLGWPHLFCKIFSLFFISNPEACQYNHPYG